MANDDNLARSAIGASGDSREAAAPGLGLSTKLLLLTAGFVMLAEVLIFLPSLANFRDNWLMQRLQAAQIASLAAEAAPGGKLPDMLRKELLQSARVRGVALKRKDQRLLILADEMPPAVDMHYDLRNEPVVDKLMNALMVLVEPDDRILRVIGEPGMGLGEQIEIVMDLGPLKQASRTFALNILGLSIIISGLAATLVYLALNGLLVRPMRRLTLNMIGFGANPGEADRIIRPSARRDEIGQAERELARMQQELAQALAQRSHLAALGLAVSKINHDLRNMLASAQLISDRLGTVKDPTVERVTPKLVASLDRAIKLCTETLRYGRAEEALPRRQRFALRPVAVEIGESLGLPRPGAIDWTIDVPEDLVVDADPDQVFRMLSNLVGNAVQVLESHPGPGDRISVRARRRDDAVVMEVADGGPGVPAAARANLFVPFQGSARAGGTGLGLAIVAELARAHGGSVALLEQGPGTTFRIVLPARAGGRNGRTGD